MYHIRLGCAVYARMNIIPCQTTVCLGGVRGGFPLLGGARGGFSSETHDVHRRIHYEKLVYCHLCRLDHC